MIVKKTAWVLIILMLLFSSMALAQDDMMPMPRNEDRWKELQSMRVWVIIQQLDLDARSERGVAVLDVINKNSDKARELLLDKQEKRRMLHAALQEKTIDEAQVTTLINEIETLQQQLLQAQLDYQDSLQKVLSPLERAKLYIAEEIFRQRLRRAMQGNQGRGRRGPGGPPEGRHNEDKDPANELEQFN